MRIPQARGNQNEERTQNNKSRQAGAQHAAPYNGDSAQSGPGVVYQDRIRGIGGVVLDAGGLACDEPVEAHLAFKPGDVLRGLIGDAGDGVAIGDELPRAQIYERLRTRAEEALTFFARLGRMRGEINDLPFRDAADLVQVQAALAFDFLRVL